MPDPTPHRTALARALADSVVASLAAGDAQGARLALDTLGRLVDAADEGRAAAPSRADVVHLDAARKRSGR